MRTDEFIAAQFVNDLHPRQALGQLLAPAFLAGVCRYDDLVFFQHVLGVRFGFIEQTVLIRGYLFTAGGIAPGQGQAQLFLEGENLGFEVFISLHDRVLICLQLLVESTLVKDQ